MSESHSLERKPVFAGIVFLVASVAGIIACTAALALAIWFAATLFIGADKVSQAFGLLASYDTMQLHAAPAPVQRLFFTVAIVVFGCMLAAVLLAALLRGRSDWRGVLALCGLQRSPATLWILIFAVGAPLYLLAASYTIKFFNPAFRTWFFVPMDGIGLPLSFVFVVLLAPLAEELLFRGWIYTWLERLVRPSTAIVATVLVFAFAHSDGGLVYPAAIIVPGLAITLARAWTGTTWASFAAHAYYNAWAWGLVLALGRDLV